MAYELINRFDDHDFAGNIVSGVRFYDTDWDSLVNDVTLTGRTLVARFEDIHDFSEITIPVAENIIFAKKDANNIDIGYDSIMLAFSFAECEVEKPNYRNEDDFFVSVTAMLDDHTVREWLVPIQSSGCAYRQYYLDLKDLIAKGINRFDALYINLLNYPCDGAILRFGGCMFFSDDPEFNTLVGIQVKLDAAVEVRVGELFEFAASGSNFITVDSAAMLMENSCIEIRHSGRRERHMISSISPAAPNEPLRIEFNGEYYGNVVCDDYPSGAEIYMVSPAIIRPMMSVDTDVVFDCYFISSEPPTPLEEISSMSLLNMESHYRGENGYVIVGTTGNRKKLSLPVTIHVFSRSKELLVRMWQALLSKIDDESNISLGVYNIPYERADAANEFDPSGEGDSFYRTLQIVATPEQRTSPINYSELIYVKSLTKTPLYDNDEMIGMSLLLSPEEPT